tara:strand:+ start:689 stop:835 length:147 start_codon:yes stop_codon:yes gene_type:complete
MVMCGASDITGYDRRTPELFNAPLRIKHENRFHQYREIAPPLYSSITP